MNFAIWLTPFTGALIGWFTNYLAVKMLFRPHEPIVIPFTEFTIQGVIPKRKHEIAKSLGEIIERELVSLEELVEHLAQKIQPEQLIDVLAGQVSEAVVNSIPNLVPDTIKMIIANLVVSIIHRQGPDLINQVTSHTLTEVKHHINLSQYIEDKVNQMDWQQLEHLILQVASRELKHIEILGGVIGFSIGLFQLFIVHLTH